MRNIKKRLLRSGDTYWEVTLQRKGVRFYGGVHKDEPSAIVARAKLEELHPIVPRFRPTPANNSAALSRAW